MLRNGRGTKPLFLAIAGALTEGVGLMLLVPILTILNQGGIHRQTGGPPFLRALTTLLPSGKPAQLLAMLALFGGLLLLRSVISVARDVNFARLNAAFLVQARSTILQRLVGAGWARIAGLEHGRVAHLLSADFAACAVAGISFINLILAAIMLVVLLGVALLLSSLLAATTLFLLLILFAVLYPSLAEARASGSELATLGVRLTSDLGQFLAGLKPALGNALGEAFLAHIDRLQRDQERLAISFARQQSRARASIGLAAGAVGAAAIVLGGLVLTISGPELFAMLVVLARTAGPALQFQQSLQLLLHALPTYGQIKMLRRELEPDPARGPPTTVPLPEGPIILDRVTYAHPGGAGVHEVSLVIEPGSLVALTGPSGAGKTSLADLLTGLIAPLHGAIIIGGAPLTAQNAASWQQAIAYVPQDSFLLNDTIRHNLLWGSAVPPSERELDAALRTVAADLIIKQRALGLETAVGERGILLSGGERQRIALARALLRRPRLMILDEATNALDSDIERRIIANLAAIPDRPTIVAVSHRAGALDLFDRVYRMEGGRLIRTG